MITKNKKTIYSYEMKCDGCGKLYIKTYDVDMETEDYMSQGISMISKLASISGWKIKDNKHICSDCLSIELEGIIWMI